MNRSQHDKAFLRVLLALIAICILAVIFGKAEGYGQAQAQPAPKSDPPRAAVPEYPLSEVQQLRLDNLQLRAVQAQQAWNAAAMKLPEYQQFQLLVNQLTGECGKVKAENKWPPDVDCDINQSPVKFGKKATATATVQPPAPAR